MQYEYTAPGADIHTAIDLYKKDLMNQERLNQVYWGSEQEQHPELKGYVTFFWNIYQKERERIEFLRQKIYVHWH